MLVRALLLVAVVAAALVLGLWWRSRQGVVRVSAPDAAAPVPSAEDDVWRDRGVELAGTATFVQFSTDHCGPCRATSRVLGALVARRDDVSHREMDIDQHLDLVRRFSVLRAPTVLVLDRDGREVARMTGAVRRAQAEQALAAVAGA
ncbi:thioredoxin family protein [Luteimicrobium sp. NPDC057192]|uniref:thioredoxin family protein n=1 Tax=Luteimicrobium sp. NPDC057192 TaxID=3346042 RepID=UPI00363299B3